MIRRVLAGLVSLGTGCAAPDFTILTEAGDGGVLLGALPLDGTLLAVGGQLDGTAGLLVRGDADGWCRDPAFADRPVWWIAGTAARWFAVGERGLVLRGGEGEPVDESVPTEATLFGVQVDGDAVWAVGGTPRANTPGGELWRRDAGGAWTLVRSDFPGPLFKVQSGWVVGVGYAGRLEGGDVVADTPPGAPRLLTVRAGDDGDVWAVGGDGRAELWRWRDGWTAIDVDPLCTNQGLNGVWPEPGGPVWVAGGFGTMAGWDGAWRCPEEPLTQQHLHAVVVWDGAPYWFGGDLLRPGGNHFTIATRGGAAISGFSVCR